MSCSYTPVSYCNRMADYDGRQLATCDTPYLEVQLSACRSANHRRKKHTYSRNSLKFWGCRTTRFLKGVGRTRVVVPVLIDKSSCRSSIQGSTNTARSHNDSCFVRMHQSTAIQSSEITMPITLAQYVQYFQLQHYGS